MHVDDRASDDSEEEVRHVLSRNDCFALMPVPRAKSSTHQGPWNYFNHGDT